MTKKKFPQDEFKDFHYWLVEFGEERHSPHSGSYLTNQKAGVVAKTALRAHELVMATHPTATIFVVRRAERWDYELILDWANLPGE